MDAKVNDQRAQRTRQSLAQAVLGRLALRSRGRLFRKYAALIVALIGAALIVNALVEGLASYRENREALASLQREKAQGAAAVIEQYLREIEGQLGWTTHASVLPGQSGIDQRRFDFLRLLRQAPAITELVHLDADGREQLRVSRLAMDVVASGADRSAEPAFREARDKRRFAGPVYFRKESEPYLTLAVSGSGRRGGVTVAEVNLKFIWDVVSRLKVGRAGAAYAVDSRGLLIAHPDIGLVLRKTELKALPQVATAIAGATAAAVAQDRFGRDVLTAHAAVAPLGWHVFVEQPLSEAFEPLYASIKRSGLVALWGLALATLAGLWFARRLVVPIQALTAGAQRIGEGDLDHRIEVRTGDEVEALAESFNAMGGRLKAYYAGLEKKVEERTAELALSLEYQTAISDVLGVISRSPTDVQPVFEAIVASAARLCEAEFSAVARLDGGLLHLVAVNNMAAEEKAAYESLFPRPPSRGFVLGRAFIDAKPTHVENVLSDPDYDPRTLAVLQRAAPYGTYLGVPVLRNGEPIGVIGCGRRDVRPFTRRQIDLVSTFADQAVIAIENARLFEAEQTRTKELKESLEYQTAISDVLGVISKSPNDLQPVLDTIVVTAERLCEADRAQIFTERDGRYRLSAHSNNPPATVTHFQANPIVPGLGTVTARALLHGKTIHVADVTQDSGYDQDSFHAKAGGARLAVPLVSGGRIIGVIALPRNEPRPFTQRQIDLVATFADQAVIAIENARLFEAERTRTKELQVALEHQTATSELLKVIGRSTLDLQPVFETLAEYAVRLCESARAFILRYDGSALKVVATHNVLPEMRAYIEQHPISPGRESGAGRAVLDRRTIHIYDVREDPEYSYYGKLEVPLRTVLAIPMLRGDDVLGVIAINRHEVRPFTPEQIALMETFADQAVIAINNVGLFEEVQARTKELTESLEYQTATSAVLNVISRSPTEVAPVFSAIVKSAADLCGAALSNIQLFDGERLDVVATHNFTPEGDAALRSMFPMPPDPRLTGGRAIIERAVVHVPDASRDPAYPKDLAQVGGWKSLLSVPMLRDKTPVGVITVGQSHVEPFSVRQIHLLQTFADQAVIAINNVGLFEEVQARTRELTRSVAELKALGEVGQAVSSSLDLQTVLGTILRHACEISSTGGGAVYVVDSGSGALTLAAGHNMSEAHMAAVREHPVSLGDTIVGRCASTGETVQVADISAIETSHPVYAALRQSGIRAILAVPLIHQGKTIGVLLVRRVMVGAFPPETVQLLQAFASQSSIAINNARLFREIEEKGEQLRVASLHKSQFLANMSHELRTPLNAILGYTELIQDGVYGEANEKTKSVLDRVQSNGRHLLGLINDVLDLSKIEAGQLTLRLDDYALADVVHTVVTATESLAANKKLALKVELAPSLPAGRGDQSRIAQVLLNLVGNAIKFTDTGEVRISAKARKAKFVIKVADTGPGIPESEHQRIFEEFHQVDSSNTKKKGGTGLGLAITKRIVELHGGRISVESDPGEGATFRVDLPVRVERQKGSS